MIKDLYEKGSANGLYLLNSFSKGVASNGSNFLSLTLQDSSGVIEAKKRDVSNEDIEFLQKSPIIRIEGDVSSFKDRLQVRISKIHLVDISTIDISNFVIPSPIPFEELEKKLDDFIVSIKDVELNKIVSYLINTNRKNFLEYPAAVRNHHEFYHGLLYHTISMCNLVDPIALNYKDVNRDLLLSGCLLHDIGKIVELSGPLQCHYTVPGNLLGHLTIGMLMIHDACKELEISGETQLLLEHMIVSHHGKLEYGACELPQTKEAVLLSMIDDLDAKMMAIEKAMNNVEEGEFTERIFALDNHSFYKQNK